MTIGALLIGVGTLIVLTAYVALPFRRGTTDADALIEAWVARERRALQQGEGRAAAVDSAGFCHQCGQPVKPEHRYCPHCGARLVED
ncbi:MAG: zinc ribbon domain-containing protein [Anaerolineae bacterium]